MSFRQEPSQPVQLKLQLFWDGSEPDKSPTLGNYGIERLKDVQDEEGLHRALKNFFVDIRYPMPSPYEIDSKGNLYWHVGAKQKAFRLKDLLANKGGIPRNRIQIEHQFEIPNEDLDEDEASEIRKRAYLKAVNQVKYEGLTPVEAISKMWTETKEWQYKPLEEVAILLLGKADKENKRAILQAQEDFAKNAPIKKYKPTTPAKVTPFNFHFEEDEEEQEEDEETPEELEISAEEDEEGEDDEEFQHAVKPKMSPVQKRWLPAPIYSAANLPQPPKSKYQYQLWSFNGQNYVPLTADEEWLGSNSVEEAKNLASSYGAKVWPKDICTKAFNIWTTDLQTGKIIPVIYDYQGTLIHLGQNDKIKADKMVMYLGKENIAAVVIPIEIRNYQGQNLFYYVGRRRF